MSPHDESDAHDDSQRDEERATESSSSTEESPAEPASPDPAAAAASDEELGRRLLELLGTLTRPIPISFQPSPPDAEIKLKEAINKRLVESKPVTVAFPTCSDVLLSLIRTSGSDEVTGFFKDYFQFCDHRLLGDTDDLGEVLDPRLRACTGKWFPGVGPSACDDGVILASSNPAPSPPGWPPFWCFPPTCVTLRGDRHLYRDVTVPDPRKLRRLFIGDVVWLFYFERLGIFQILGRILDDYAYIGAHPISDGSLQPGSEDDVVAVVLEAMVRQTEAGGSSKVRDRNSTFERTLGWSSEAGWKLNQASRANQEFTRYFHQFLAKALEFYRDKRLAVAIRSSASPTAQPSTETLTGISVTLGELKKTFERFHYGRNYTNTLSGIVWVIGGMALVERLREDLGIPRAYGSPHEFIPAAYNILVLGNKDAPLETSRYENHKICAEAGRDILLDIEMVDHTDRTVGGSLDLWLNLIEGKVEAYRTAYRSLTGTDLGTPGPHTIEQQA